MKRAYRCLSIPAVFLAICLLLTLFAGAAELQTETIDCIHLQLSLPEKANYVTLGPPQLDYWMVNFSQGTNGYTLSVCAGERTAYPLKHSGTSSRETIHGLEYTVYSSKLTPSSGTVIYSSGDSLASLPEDVREDIQEAQKAALKRTYYSLDYVTERDGWKYSFSFQKTDSEFTGEEKNEISAIMSSVHFLSMDAPAFADVSGHWAQAEIQRAVDYNLFSGAGDGCSHPDENLSRAMLAQVLYRMFGDQLPVQTGRFSDVPDGSWYAEAANTLAAMGVVEGSNGKFSPNGSVTREQLAVMLYRYARTKINNPPEIEGGPLDYVDADQISDWATDAMTWAVEQGLITGLGDHTLAPKMNVSRAQAAAILVRYLERDS